MKRMIDKLLINEILRHAPHRKVVRVFPVFAKTIQVQQKMMEYADDIYLDGFISDVFQHQELNYQANMGPINSPFRFQHHQKNMRANNKGIKERQQIEERLLLTIKILNQQKYSFLSYTEANQNIVMMTAEEARKYKKYLVYIYKMLSNLRQITNKDKQNMINDLKEIIVKKIYEGHQNGEQQKKVKKELERIDKVVDKQRIMAEKEEKESIEKVKKIYERETEIKNKNKSEE